MALTRRNMLLGLVVLVVGAGVIGASGAFSSVQAERTVNLGTAGDDAALLQFNDLDSEIVNLDQNNPDAEVGVLNISQQKLNANAKTIFSEAFEITNNGNDDIEELYIQENGSTIAEDGVLDFRAGGANGDSIVGDGNSESLSVQGTMQVTVVIDTTGSTTNSDLQAIDDVTVVANDTDATGVN